MIDLIELALQKQGYKFQRIDGQTSLQARGEALTQFNEDPECTIMLASIGSCGEGLVIHQMPCLHALNCSQRGSYSCQ